MKYSVAGGIFTIATSVAGAVRNKEDPLNLAFGGGLAGEIHNMYIYFSVICLLVSSHCLINLIFPICPTNGDLAGYNIHYTL